ncbi:Negative regulator of sexual conjugation and meiosis [Psilocybe cubensis]|uniref:non-specific serine/threonine protein kinase n=2 Tax=Psilocybe cubensis TaxID=181762 RepID=A0A8H7XZ69_PSICU|nr:Negative regulator of sexual conjugation and meiosis [Psilocybe cubensis]KAH9478742.1 Negative regulator of sexual conjugation and meiosis [Psilocybe cubensis]
MSSKAAPAVTSPLHPPVGTLIDGGSLELVEVLGVGGYGVVYRAVDTTRQPGGQKSYAVKCLVASGHQTPRQRQIHIREIALHQLASAHPGVVTLHRVVEQGTHTYIIMDYATDHDLFTQILHKCRYLGDDALIKEVFLQLLDAVEYCHNLGIYHRDLKPENILCFDDGLRIAITDFGLATTDKLSDEFRTGSVYHMSPECQGGEFAPTGNYSPMFNDIWSLGIILLNLATGRNPWKSATPSDPTFQAYLRDPMGFLPTVLPISPEVNEILVRMLDVDWRERSTLREVRYAIEEINNFYSDGVVFEGSMARCPWESGMDIDSASSGTNPEDIGPQSPTAQAFPEEVDPQLGSHWSKDSTSDIVFATQSLAQESSYGIPWTNYSSCGATWAYESPVSSDSEPDHFRMDVFERSSTPSSVQTAETSLPPTPNHHDTSFGQKATKPELRSTLLINTNIPRPRIYDASASMTSYSTGTSIMQTAIEYDPYSSMFFINSPISPGKVLVMPDSAITAVGEDKDMTSPTVWSASSATQTSSLSSYSSSSTSSSVADEDLRFARSRTPSPEPDVHWTSFPAQVQSLQAQQCQLSPSVSTQITDVLPHSSRPNHSFLFAFNKHPHAHPTASAAATVNTTFASGTPTSSASGHKSSTFSRLAIKLFPRSPSPSTPSSTSDSTVSRGRAATEASHSPFARRQTPSPTPHAAAWGHSAVAAGNKAGSAFQQEHDGRHTADKEVQHGGGSSPQHHHLRSTRHWYLPGRFRTSAEVN